MRRGGGGMSMHMSHLCLCASIHVLRARIPLKAVTDCKVICECRAFQLIVESYPGAVVSKLA